MKLLYVGFEHHFKTGSNQFLLDLLREHYELDIRTNYDFNPKAYDIILFYQTTPPLEVYNNCDTNQAVIVPMYDGVRTKTLHRWEYYKDSKILCFCKALYNKLDRAGFDTMYIKYYPKPMIFQQHTRNEAFFWLRNDEVTIQTAKELLPETPVFVHRSREGDLKEEYLSLLKNRSLFISPRAYEGIGMATLEAMACSLAPIAPNNPTMNEYITHNKNGYLYDLDNPKKINISNINQVRLNAFKSVEEGYLNWEKNKSLIIDFMNSPVEEEVNAGKIILGDLFNLENYKTLIRKIRDGNNID